jgi:hypothetical protein
MLEVDKPESCSAMRSVSLLLVVPALSGVLWACGEDFEPEPTRSAPERDARPALPIPCPEREVAFDGTVKPDGKRRFDARTLLDMTETQAKARARRYGCVVRVAARDGEGLVLTADERPDRVDVRLEDGVVVDVKPS